MGDMVVTADTNLPILFIFIKIKLKANSLPSNDDGITEIEVSNAAFTITTIE